MNEKIADLIMAAESNDADAQIELYGYIFEDDVSEGNKKQIVDWLQRSAKLGNARSMEWLGICYTEGIVFDADEKKAFDWFVESAKAGNGCAFLNVGEYYKEGKIVAKDYAKAIEMGGTSGDAEEALGSRLKEVHRDDPAWWEAVAVRSVKCPGVPFAVGNHYYTLNDPDLGKAIRFYKIGAEQGYGHSQYVLGKFYYTGEGVEKDPQIAFQWLEKAAQQEVVPAMYYLGKLYADDQSAVFDMGKAIYCLKRNAAAGDDSETPGLVELELSWCFALGVGVDEVDEDEANEDMPDKYMDRATYYLSWVEPNLPKRAVVEVDEESWWYRHVKQGDEQALYWLGMCYERVKQLVPPKGGDKNSCMLDCFRKAAEKGNAHAQFSLAHLLYYGPTEIRDREDGIRWYRLAAAEGHPDAMEQLEEIEAMGQKS